LCKPSIEVRSKKTLQPLSRTFQQYVARHLHVNKSEWFLTFNGWESNWQFDHNLCFEYPNGSWKPILDIYILRAFQWYKEIFNLMNFDPYNRPLKIWESIETQTPKMGAHLGMWGFILSHSPTLLEAWNVTPMLHSWPTPLQALVLIASPKLGLWQFVWHLFIYKYYFIHQHIYLYSKHVFNPCYSWMQMG
jgi:hypothetical protein